MDVVATARIPAPPAVAFEMLSDPEFARLIGIETEARQHTVERTGDRVTTMRILPAPPQVAAFVGSDLAVDEVVEWEPATADGTGDRRGTFTVTVPGKPVVWRGTTTIVASGDGSILTYTGPLTVSIPIIGKSLEKQAAHALESLVSIQERVAAEYMANRPR
jgi:hypothetical protein